MTAPAPPAESSALAVRNLRTESAVCCLCGKPPNRVVGTGRDFEYDTSDDVWRMTRCDSCDVLVLDPRPVELEFDVIYPPHYHAFQFDEAKYGFVSRVRRRLEARRLLNLFRDLPPDARILDVGCGDGFHLGLLKEFGPRGWQLRGIDASDRAAARARSKGLNVSHGTVENAEIEPASVDAVLMIMTVEHVADPFAVVARVAELLKPGGRLVVVTDNIHSVDTLIFRKRFWGGYHFPRHTYLFSRDSLTALAAKAGLTTHRVRTLVSPVNWVYSIRNWLVGHYAPGWLVRQFSLTKPLPLAAFTVLDNLLRLVGRAAVLRGIFVKAQEGDRP